MDFVLHNWYELAPLDHMMHNHEKSSTYSTSWSQQELSGMSESSLNGHHSSAQSNNDTSSGKQQECRVNAELSLGIGAFRQLSLDNNQPSVYSSTSRASPPLQMHLPYEPAGDKPIFVNAKQYHAILRRRHMRAKLEAQNKITKVRKPYLHESRHIHALKRARGSGGRFLNTKQTQEASQNVEPNSSTGGASAAPAMGLFGVAHLDRLRFAPADCLATVTQTSNKIGSGNVVPGRGLQQRMSTVQ